MKPQAGDSAGGSDALAALRAEVARLSERIAALEAAAGVVGKEAGRPAAPVVNQAPPPAPPAEPISEETLAVISAAIAAFLGKKASIRQIRLLGAAAWSQQGRVTIQASHALPVRQTRSPH